MNSKSTAANFSLLTIAAFGLSFGAVPRAGAVFIVAPNSAAATEGNDNNGNPFNLATVGGTPQRFQQVYMADQFAILNPTGGVITALEFRPDGVFGAAFTATLPDIRIDLSTTSATADALSLTFASNVGANNTIVFGGVAGSPLTISSDFTGPAGGPKDFDIIVTLTTPFFYNPALGNLLLDVRNFGGGLTTFFDSVDVGGDALSRVFTFAGNVNSPAADVVDSLGLVTRFVITPVPEPSAWVVLLGGVGMCAGFRRFGRGRA